MWRQEESYIIYYDFPPGGVAWIDSGPVTTVLPLCNNIIVYSGRECQVAHWKGAHKRECSAKPKVHPGTATATSAGLQGQLSKIHQATAAKGPAAIKRMAALAFEELAPHEKVKGHPAWMLSVAHTNKSKWRNIWMRDVFLLYE